MRYLLLSVVLPVALLSSTVHAATQDDCISMARNYITTMEQSEPIKDVIYSREKFMLNCNTDDNFGQELKSLVIENKALKAVHVMPVNKRKTSSQLI